MSRDKQTTSQSSTQQVQQTPEEQELNRLLLERTRATQGGTIQAQQQGLGLVNQLLAGGTLPGYLGALQGGISNEAIGTQAAQLAKQYGAGFQNQGLANSGVAFRETSRGIANELLYPTEQFNIGNYQNLLNLALSGQAQVQQPISAGTSQLSSNLAGLRSTTSTGTSTTTSANPFLKSFQQSAGQGMGNIFNPQTYIGSGGVWGTGGAW
jgi:hypothetical protein